MKRLLIIAVLVLAAAAAVVVPAIIGLAGNPSFNHQLPVRVPTQARSGPAVFTDDSLGSRPARATAHRDDDTRPREDRRRRHRDDRRPEQHSREDRESGTNHDDGDRGGA
jgi:hypothetical protein